MKFEQLCKTIVERYDAWDEADEMYRIGDDGRMKSRSFKHALLGQARKEGYSDSHEAALKRAGIFKSKFDPKKYVKKNGDKWVQVFPYGKPTQATPQQQQPNTPPPHTEA